MPETVKRQGRYFEEFEVGQRYVSVGRTITDADIVNFAGITGDYTQLHTNVEAAKRGPFGRPVAQGLLGLAIANGLLVQLGIIENTVLAFRQLTWKFSRPVYTGDTIRAEGVVSAVKAMPRLGGGTFTLDVTVLNQEDEVVQRGAWVTLVASRPAPEASDPPPTGRSRRG